MQDGARIEVRDGRLLVPDRPILPFIEGDGIGPDIWRASRRVMDAAVAARYGGRRSIAWLEVLAGEKAFHATGEWLPAATLQALKTYRVGIKGPLTTPVGGGIRSLNVALRRELDLYACVRPVRYFPGVVSPVAHPERVDVVIFRENTEDIYAGIEWASGTAEARALREFLRGTLGVDVREDSALGIKPMSPFGSKRLVRKAIQYALDHHRRGVTLVHKGNIMKYTEGAFRDWGYEVAREFGERVVRESELEPGASREGKVVVRDLIADNTFQQLLLRPADFDVIATPNLNGDYLSDAVAAQVGGIGLAPGGNISDEVAVFEATHGTAPKYAGLDRVNPSSLLLSGVMMLRHIGWVEAADDVESALARTIRDGVVTYDLARGRPDAREVSTSGFADAIIERLGGE